MSDVEAEAFYHFYGKYSLILTLMAAIHLKKVGTGATKGWKSTWCESNYKKLEEHLTAYSGVVGLI